MTLSEIKNTNDKVTVIFVCTGNTCRSQMAEGLMREFGRGKVEVHSAGSHPEEIVAPYAIKDMAEIGIDISKQKPKGFDAVKDIHFDWVITRCDHARDFCPVFVSKAGESERVHWSIPDPVNASNDPVESIKGYRSARDDIAGRIKDWLQENQG